MMIGLYEKTGLCVAGCYGNSHCFFKLRSIVNDSKEEKKVIENYLTCQKLMKNNGIKLMESFETKLSVEYENVFAKKKNKLDFLYADHTRDTQNDFLLIFSLLLEKLFLTFFTTFSMVFAAFIFV